MMRISSDATRVVCLALALGLVAASFVDIGRALAQSDASGDQAVYQARFKTMMSGGDYYTPLEAVPGVRDPKLLPRSSTTTIAPAVLAAATDYAKANHSSAFIVWRNGAIETASYFGDANPHGLITSKSLAKPLTAIVVGRAIKLGYIKSLDQPVSDFITEWRGGPKAAIKVRYLLDMRSGLLGQAPATTPEDMLNKVYLSPHHDQILINDYPLIHTPGVRYDYANAVADLVALVIERATHQRYAHFVSTQVLQPLGAEGGSVWLDRPDGLAHSACCILLPAETWLRLGLLLLEDGRWDGKALLPKGYVAEMKTPTAENPHYGLGVYVGEPYLQRRPFSNPDMPGPRVLQSEPYLAHDLFVFDGNADQVVYIVPSEKLVILRTGGQPPAKPEWDNAALPNIILRALKNEAR